MMRRGVVVAAVSLTLSACVAGDKVTLLESPEGKPVGAVAVLQEGGQETVLDRANLQARLTRGTPRVRQLDEIDPAYARLIADLPPPPSPLILRNLPFGEITLTAQQITDIKAHLSDLDSRPGYQILVRGFTDSVGDEAVNTQLSQDRAEQVARIIRGEGYTIADEDVIGMSEFDARRLDGDEVPNPDLRRVEVIIR